MDCCSSKCGGPGFKSPSEAIKGPKEKFIFVTCPSVEKGKQDALACVDVDESSDTYQKIISHVKLTYKSDEIHHSGWNTCSGCYDDNSKVRSHMILPCLDSSRIYAINTKDPKNMFVEKIIEPDQLKKFNVTFPHTSHCLANGDIMISTLGDNDGNGRGNFILLNGETFEPKSTYVDKNSKEPQFNYDFWYQPRFNTMLSTEWGTPNIIKKGFNVEDVKNGHYGNKIHVFNWKEKTLRQSLELEGPTGLIPLEVRFLHNPTKAHAFVGTALGSAIYHLYDPEGDGNYKTKIAASVNPLKVEGWAMDEMPGLITDILISMDDKYLYASCWLHGSVRQYNIEDPFNIFLNDEIFLGGSIHKETKVKVLSEEMKTQPDALYLKGKKIEGSPQMLQLSLDGKRLFVTTSLYTIWDQQFYPELMKSGGTILQVLINQETGKMTLNKNFLVSFDNVDGVKYLAHEMRFQDCDCTSDIFV